MFDQFELHRRVDGLVYRFVRKSHSKFGDGYERSDGRVWIVRHPTFGWVAIDEAEVITGCPWLSLLADQGPEPPHGEWVSQKADKAYVYTLHWIDA